MSSNENNSLRIYFSSKSDTEDDFTRKKCFFNEPVYADEKLIRLKNSKKENCNTCASNAQESTNWNAYSGLLLGITTKHLEQLKKISVTKNIKNLPCPSVGDKFQAFLANVFRE